MVRICDDLLNIPEVDTAIRVGDVFAQLIEHLYEVKNSADAYKYLTLMKQKKIVITPYLDMEMVENIYRDNGINPNQGAEAGDDIEEDIQEDF
jgi:intraflagellar transport protein 140